VTTAHLSRAPAGPHNTGPQGITTQQTSMHDGKQPRPADFGIVCEQYPMWQSHATLLLNGFYWPALASGQGGEQKGAAVLDAPGRKVRIHYLRHDSKYEVDTPPPPPSIDCAVRSPLRKQLAANVSSF